MYSIEEGIQHGLHKLGYQSLRDGQQEVIEAYLKGKDVFFCSPTGSGKSLCNEIALYIFDFVLFGTNSVRDKDRMDSVCIVDPVCIVSFDIIDGKIKWHLCVKGVSKQFILVPTVLRKKGMMLKTENII
jgi:hypothetical protein